MPQLLRDADGNPVPQYLNEAGTAYIALTGEDGSAHISAQGHAAHDEADDGNPVKVGYYAKATAPSAVADGDIVNAWADQNGRQQVGSDETFGTPASAVPTKGVMACGTDGTNARHVKTETDGTVHVKIISTATQQIEGDTAHDAADAGKPVKIGAKANAEEPAAVTAENDRANIGTDLYGNLRSVGNMAHSTADRGNPVKVGGKASASEPVAVDENDRVNTMHDLYGNQKFVGNIPHNGVDRGDPVKVGFYAKSTAPAVVVNGDRADGWSDLHGRQVVTSDETFGTHDVSHPAKNVMVGGACQATADTPDDGDSAELSLTTGNELRVVNESASAVHDAAAPARTLLVGAEANATADTPDEGDISNFSVDLNSNLRVKNDLAETAPDLPVPTNAMFMGAKANAEEPAVVSAENDLVGLGTDLKGNPRVVGNVLHDTADTGAPIKVGGKANAAAPAAVGENDRVNASFTLEGLMRILSKAFGEKIVLHTGGAETANGSGTAMTDLDGYSVAEIICDLTAAANIAADTFDLYIEGSNDGGTTWIECAHFPQMLGNGGAKQYLFTVSLKALVGTACIVSDDTLAVNTGRHFLGNAMRARWVIVDGGAASQSFTFAVTANMKS